MTTSETTAELLARITAELADVARGPIRSEDEPTLDEIGDDDDQLR